MMPLDFTRISHRLRMIVIPAVLALAALFLSCGDMYSDLIENKNGILASLGVGQPKIAFTSRRDGNNEIYVMDQDGGNQTNLTKNPASDLFPAWSPDNTRIAFASNRNGNLDIFVMNADGSNQYPLTSGTGDNYYPSWSNDGAHIVFSSNRLGNYRIYIMDANGDNQTPLTNNPSGDIYPYYLPDGGRIAFSRDDGGFNRLYIMYTNGTGQTALSVDFWHYDRAFFSPDGTRVVLNYNNSIYIINADGSNRTNISTGGYQDEYPCWSSDGSRIIFQSWRDGTWDIYSMKPDGSDVVRLTDDANYDMYPACSRSGKTPVTTAYSYVRYYGNGAISGSPPPGSHNYLMGQNALIEGNTGSFVKPGCSFNGWNTAADGSGTNYDASDTIAMGFYDVKLYVNWEPYSISYNANGGTEGSVPVDSNLYYEGDTVTVLGNPGGLTKRPDPGTAECADFGGWNTQPDGSGTTYTEGQTFSVGKSNVILYVYWAPLALRSVGPAGGWVFYDKGSFTNGWRYLEAASADVADSVWGTRPLSVPGAGGYSIGDGWQNTQDIINGDPLPDKAADRCVAYSVFYNGRTHNDWFLPSNDELLCMYDELHSFGIGGFVGAAGPTSFYWSSTETTLPDYANLVYFYNGTYSGYWKDGVYNVRPIRRF